MLEGPLAALDAVEKATGEQEVNMIGYCLGGTLTAARWRGWRQKDESRVKSVTFFTALIDFSEPGELGVFVDEGVRRQPGKEDGGARLSRRRRRWPRTFNMLRANDLIWSFVVNNYLLGKDPFPFDLLYWNSDATRMPAKMHTFYLRNMYIKNKLREPGGITLAGVPIDLSKVDIPGVFHLHGRRPYRAVEDDLSRRAVAQRSGALRAWRLGPHRRHRQSAGGEQVLVLDQRQAARHRRRMAVQRGEAPGSWWTDWGAWIAGFGGEKVPARTAGAGLR